MKCRGQATSSLKQMARTFGLPAGSNRKGPLTQEPSKTMANKSPLVASSIALHHALTVGAVVGKATDKSDRAQSFARC